MAQARLPVRKIREVLRLKAERLSDRQIAAAIGSARSTVQECLRRCREAGLAWPLAPELDEEALHARLYRRQVPLSRTPAPDFAKLHAELRRPGVTRMLLWQEYKADAAGRLAVQRVLRSVPALAGWAGCRAAPDPSARRQAVCRLRRPDDADVTDRLTGLVRPGADFRRGARRQQLHLRRSDLDASVARLAGFARSRAGSSSVACRPRSCRTT